MSQDEAVMDKAMMGEAKIARPGLTWSEDFLVGYGPMDDVHREFVRLVDGLLSCPEADLYGQLAIFAEHAQAHFAEERRLMETSQFPGMQCHAQEHTAVLTSVDEVLPLVKEGRTDIGRSLATELARWFPHHADYMDSSLAQWIVQQRTGGSPVIFRCRGSK
jgi:hemerythrin